MPPRLPASTIQKETQERIPAAGRAAASNLSDAIDDSDVDRRKARKEDPLPLPSDLRGWMAKKDLSGPLPTLFRVFEKRFFRLSARGSGGSLEWFLDPECKDFRGRIPLLGAQITAGNDKEGLEWRITPAVRDSGSSPPSSPLRARGATVTDAGGESEEESSGDVGRQRSSTTDSLSPSGSSRTERTFADIESSRLSDGSETTTSTLLLRCERTGDRERWIARVGEVQDFLCQPLTALLGPDGTPFWTALVQRYEGTRDVDEMTLKYLWERCSHDMEALVDLLEARATSAMGFDGGLLRGAPDSPGGGGFNMMKKKSSVVVPMSRRVEIIQKKLRAMYKRGSSGTVGMPSNE
jgi:hypothetical protein